MISRASTVVVLVALGCASTRDANQVADDVHARSGATLDPNAQPDRAASVPPGVRLDDGVSEDEAVALAIWNHPELRADLTRLAVAEADVAQARRPSNPTLRVLFPAGPQQLGALLTWPLENLVLMRRRIDLAKLDVDAVAASAVQTALELTRTARFAHADWALAGDRLQVRRQLAEQADAIAAIAEARASAGDVAPREGDAARADALVAADEAMRAEQDVALAETRLRLAIGCGELRTRLRPSTSPPPADDIAGRGDLDRIALDSRPDLRAATLAIESAQKRLALQKLAFVRFAGVGNLQGRSVTGGVQLELPIADQNQAGVRRARAQLDAAKCRHHALRLRIVADVTVARGELTRALASLTTYRDTIAAARESDIEIVTAAYELGELEYSAVLLASQRLEGARLREVELVADVRRGRADLERALGRRTTTLAPETPR